METMGAQERREVARVADAARQEAVHAVQVECDRTLASTFTLYNDDHTSRL